MGKPTVKILIFLTVMCTAVNAVPFEGVVGGSEFNAPLAECAYTLRPGQEVTGVWCEEAGQTVFDEFHEYSLDWSGVFYPVFFIPDFVEPIWPPPQVCVDFRLYIAEEAEPGIYPFDVVLHLHDSSHQVIASFILSDCVIVPLGGDLDGDRDVDIQDFAMFAEQLGQVNCSEGNAWCGGADLAPEMPDGTVNIEDLQVMAENWLSAI